MYNSNINININTLDNKNNVIKIKNINNLDNSNIFKNNNFENIKN